MKMVSAAKLRKAQDAIVRIRPYAEKLQEILSGLSSSMSASEGIYSGEREVKNVLFVAITSNRGLCGAFNANVIKQVNRLIRGEYSKCKSTVLPVGKKADDFFKQTEHYIKGMNLSRHLNHLWDNLDFEHVAPEALKLMNVFASKEFDKVVLVYNRFKNAGVQVLTADQFLPVLPPETNEDKASKATIVLPAKQTDDFIFEPSRKQIVEELTPKSLKIQFYKALLDSRAAEHGARMTTMHQATDNATELLKELRLSYNKARQAAITGEILEIVGGAEALNN